MSREDRERAAKLQAEIETLQEQVSARQTELSEIEAETPPKVYSREHFDNLSPARQNAVVSELQAGTAQLVD